MLSSSHFLPALCTGAAAVVWLAASSDSRADERDRPAPFMLDFGEPETEQAVTVRPEKQGLAFDARQLPRAARPLSMAVSDFRNSDSSAQVRPTPALRIDFGSAPSCEYWCQFKAGAVDWRDIVGKLLVIRLTVPADVSATLSIDVGAGPQRLAMPLAVSSPIVRTAMARDGFVDWMVALETLQPDLALKPDGASLRRLAVQFSRETAAEREAPTQVWLHRISCDSMPDPDTVLRKLERRAYAYFETHTHPDSGLVRDRASNFGTHGTTDSRMASISATGYYLSYLPEAVRRGWVTKEEAVARARRTLESAARLNHHHGLFYHFLDWEHGARWRNVEVSTLDSAIFLHSAIVCSVAFPELDPLVDHLLERIDWSRFLVEKDGKPMLSLGWTPERGLLGPLDVRTSEAAMPLLLAIGSGQVGTEVWYNTSVEQREIAGYSVLHGHLPLFVSYYGLSWANLEGRRDRERVDLHQTAFLAAQANRSFCRDVAREPTYQLEQGGFWGISAGDSIDSAGRPTYIAPGPLPGAAGGTVWPMTALAAYPWLSRELEADLMRWRASPLWPLIDGQYGIAPFNLENGYIGRDIIAIDLGAFLLNLANYRQNTIWKLWQQHPLADAAYRRVGLHPPQ